MELERVIGNLQARERLMEDFENEKFPHAYLFCGPADIGKFFCAMEFAKEIQGRGKEVEKNKISSEIEAGYHSDTIVIRKAAVDEKIKIEELKKELDKLYLSRDGNFRIMLIEEIERMTPESANMMLKILEEPPEKVLFLLTTSRVENVLETILSRVRKIDFRILDRDELEKGLALKYSGDIKSAIKLSAGRSGLAIRMLEDEGMMQAYERVYSEIRDIFDNKNIAKGMAYISQIHGDELLIRIFINTCFVVLNDKLAGYLKEGNNLGIEKVAQKLENVLNLSRQSETNMNSRLMLENLILQI